MPIAFSSFGDLVTVLQLAWQLRAALSDAAGARAEIDALVVDIDTFTRALQQIRASIEQRRTALEPAVENGIVHAIATCSDVLRHVLSKITAFKTRASGGGRCWKRYWGMAVWSVLGGREEVDRLRQRLSEQVQVIHTFLFLAETSDLAALNDKVERQGETLRELNDSLKSVHVMRKRSEIPYFIWDPLAERYYQAYARTSVSRLQELYSRTLCKRSSLRFTLTLDSQTGDLHLGDGSQVANLQCAHLKFWVPDRPALVLSCIVWRDDPYDHWQVLIGLPGEHGLRVFLERDHIHRGWCTCTPPCKDLLARRLPDFGTAELFSSFQREPRISRFLETSTMWGGPRPDPEAERSARSETGLLSSLTHRGN
ncbi:hypothetical protein AURDEDRAFT_155075 [Auricularia subglabra TFB-10046 SS5]|uniref:Fungal N-terminal domain-containing protein n=1 Tax=Auricularia subglabra (strain TFB-10046 / SS5) TaxID=717982 RepID=J0CUS5_AURST|nr:hypothetical protein AURDEDRAFT_155075 [Auricularia subglabra TFB-10046 SS5]